MRKVSLVILTLVVMVVAPLAVAQQNVDVPDCVDKLDDPCGPVVNSTTAKPPASCCRPLRNALMNELPCICSLVTEPELIQTLNLNVTAALTLPERCGIQFDIMANCKALGRAPAMAPAPAMHKHPHKHPHHPKHSHSPSPSPSPSLAPPMSSDTSPPSSSVTSPAKGSNTGNAPRKIAQTGLVFGSLLLATLMIN